VDAVTGEIKRGDSAGKLGLPEGEKLSTSAQKSLQPKRTTHNGEETVIRLYNATAAPVDLFLGGRRWWPQILRSHRAWTRLTNSIPDAGHVWLVTDANGSPLGIFEAAPDALEVEIDWQAAKPAAPAKHRGRKNAELSPDGKFFRAAGKSRGHARGNFRGNGGFENCRDARKSVARSGHLVAGLETLRCFFRQRSAAPYRDRRRVIAARPASARSLQTYDYFKPGDALPQVQPVLISVAEKTATVIADDLFTNNFTPDGELNNFRWSPRGDEFYFDYNQRGHQLYRILAVNATNGVERTVVEERSQTFVDYETKTWREWLDNSGELLLDERARRLGAPVASTMSQPAR
jgi:hypothetical protein